MGSGRGSKFSCLTQKSRETRPFFIISLRHKSLNRRPVIYPLIPPHRAVPFLPETPGSRRRRWGRTLSPGPRYAPAFSRVWGNEFQVLTNSSGVIFNSGDNATQMSVQPSCWHSRFTGSLSSLLISRSDPGWTCFLPFTLSA